MLVTTAMTTPLSHLGNDAKRGNTLVGRSAAQVVAAANGVRHFGNSVPIDTGPEPLLLCPNVVGQCPVAEDFADPSRKVAPP
jgi:hypothetical protein